MDKLSSPPTKPHTHKTPTKDHDSLQDFAQKYTIEVGKLGRAVGLKGSLAFYATSDFIDFIQAGTMLVAHKPSRELIVESITTRHAKGSAKGQASGRDDMLITFVGVDSRESAQELVNARLFTSEQETRAKCPLKQGEYFYFDIIGLEVIEAGEVLGRVIDIERIGATDYLLVAPQSPESTQAQPRSKPHKSAKPKIFYLPYIDAYVLSITLASSTQKGGVFTQNAKSLCE